jgi:putative toxin-antitoxin system antitoxin component (TIGR02293 family)
MSNQSKLNGDIIFNLLSSSTDYSNINTFEIISIIREGIPVETFSKIQLESGLSHPEFSQLLNLKIQAISRRKNHKLTQWESEKLLHFCKVMSRANIVFGDQFKSAQWLRTSNPSLNSHTPASYLDTGIGAEIILNLLGRIEHGVFS